MQFPHDLVRGRFLAREKRFLIHVELDDGRRVIAHTNNTGRMSGLLNVGAPVWLSPAAGPQRKLKWTLEIVQAAAPSRPLAGVNTALANVLVREALEGGLVERLSGGGRLQAEVRYGSRSSRVDFLLCDRPDAAPNVWIEVKNATLVIDGAAAFPDAPTARGRKHLLELQEMVAGGDRAALVFCVQRGDADCVRPADEIDPEYGALLREAAAAGVELYAVQALAGPEHQPRGIEPVRVLPVVVS